MLPLYNSFPHQLQSSAPPPQQNSMPSQPQMGMNNPQIPIPFNGVAVPNMPGSMVTQPGFMNGPNHLLPLQNNHLGMPHLGSLCPPMPQQANPHVRFGPQGNVSNMNSVSGFPVRGQAAFGHNNLPNLPQFNQNVGLPFAQFCMPNPLQNMNQFVAMQTPQMPNHQNAFGPQAGVIHNPGFNSHIGNMNHYQYNQILQHNLSLPAATSQLQSNLSTTVSNPIQIEQTSNLQASVFMGTQGNPTKKAGANASSSSWKNPSSKKFKRNPKRGMAQGGFQNPQFHHVKNGKKKFRFPNADKGRGLSNQKSDKFSIDNSVTQGREQRRSLSLMYSEQEIQQWREERRKNYPSKGNIEKKLSEKLIDKEASERGAKIRQKQLKEILAKQAELGVEVAEIPACYLSDPKKQGQGREENERSWAKTGKLHNKFEKQTRNNNKERYSKKQRLNENGSPTVPFVSRKEPTLLQKLHSADVKRDKSRLLQALRFMVMNSFFKDWPDKPLKFPAVIVKDGSGEDNDGMVGNMCQTAVKVDVEHNDNTIIEKIDEYDHSHDNIDNDDDTDDGGEDDSKNSYERNNDKQEDGQEEEGEIIN